MLPSLNEQMDAIRMGASEVLPEDELAKKIEKSIEKNTPLNVKLGCDPSKPDLHLGHAVVLHKLRQFQDLGHKAILIVGDFTAMIGDPSGKSKTRPQLTLEQTRINGQTYLDQATRILSETNLDIKYNSEWLDTMKFSDVIRLAAKYTVAQLLERDDFSKRYKSGRPISVHELLYPLAQAMDSYAIKADVELGGTDQKFNLLVGREIQKNYGSEPQCLVMLPILEGTDGVEKMSKSLDNYIAITDEPREMFGKAMSIPDEIIVNFARYAAWAPEDEVAELERGLKDGSVHPRDAKAEVASKIVDIYWGEGAGAKALDEFNRMFQKKEIPDDIPEFRLGKPDANQLLMDVLVDSNLLPSKKQARQTILQGGVYLDGVRIEDFKAVVDFSEKKLIKVGKKKFLRVVN